MATAAYVIAELGRELGRPIAMAAPLDKECVFIARHGQPAQNCLDAVAAALHASVQKSGPVLRIVRTPADRTQFRDRRCEVRAAWIKTSVDEFGANIQRAVRSRPTRLEAYVAARDEYRRQMWEFETGARVLLDAAPRAAGPAVDRGDLPSAEANGRQTARGNPYRHRRTIRRRPPRR